MPQQAALVAALLAKHCMCLACIADHTRIKAEAVETALTDMRELRLVGVIQGLRRYIIVADAIGECDRCGQRTVVFTLG